MSIFKNGRINLHSGEFSGLSIIAVIVVLRLLGLLQALEWNVLDFALRKRPAEVPDNKVTIVFITETDIQTSLSYPISDQSLAALLNRIQTYTPRVIGLDIFRDFPVGEGDAILAKTLATSDNIVGIQRITEPKIFGHPALPPERVGFVDVPPDDDGFLRRSLLGVHDDEQKYQFSLTLRLAEQYLAQEGLVLENGQRDPNAMRFGRVEIPHFHSYTGGYVRADNAGHQTLINFRAGPTPFTQITYRELMSGEIDGSVLQDRVVLVGYRAVSAKDFVNVAALVGVNPSLVPGVEVQAHAVSQVINGVLHNRAFLRTLPPWIDYGLVVVAGLMGLVLASSCLKALPHFLVVAIVSGGLVLVFYGLILVGWWLPLVPVVAVFLLNAMVLYPMYQAQVQLRSQLHQREYLIDWTFGTIHNGPLQTLARFLKEWPTDSSQPNFEKTDLQQLNQEIRDLYDAMRQEMLLPEQQLVLSQQQIINLDIPLSELLYEIYSNTIKRRADFFGKIIHITDFKPIADERLTPEQKRQLGRFLEEALLNVCKYATDAKRIKVICRPEETHHVIRIIDNGTSNLAASNREGHGTRQAKQLAQKLGGTFERQSVNPKGVRCELCWPLRTGRWQGRPWFGKLDLRALMPTISKSAAPTSAENSKAQ